MRALLLSSGLGAVPRYLGRGARVGFIATASEPYENPTFIAEDREQLRRLGFGIEEIDVSGDTQASIGRKICRG
jgi:peptidase E